MQRNVVFDIARALCIIWIVCFWHMNDMIVPSQRFYDLNICPQILYITNGVLACFTFISGFFLSKKIIKEKRDVSSFYAKRFFRFFIPLLITCMLFCIGGWLSPLQVISTCCGVAQLLPSPYPLTVWYLSMLILFYILTPLILLMNKRYYRGCAIVFIYIVLLLYHYFVQHVDERLLLYYWFYFIPFIIQFNKSSLIIIFVVVVCMTLGSVFYKENILLLDIINRIGISSLLLMLILLLSWCICKITFMNNMLAIVAYASMFAYLYHREVYVAFKLLFKEEHILVYYVPLVWIVIFMFSYWAQKYYDRFLEKLNMKR